MKNIVVLKIVSICTFFLLFNLEVPAQSEFSKLSFYGTGYKLTSVNTVPRYSICLDFGKSIPEKNKAEQYNGGGIDSLMSKIYSDPVLFQSLFEILGGDFFIGSFNDAPAFENFKLSGRQIYTLSVGYRLHSKLEAEIQFSQFKNSVTADFPVAVFDNITFEPRLEAGHLKTTLKNTIFKASGNYLPFSGRIQPFAGLGLLYQKTKASTTEAQIRELVFDLSTNRKITSFGIAFQAGAKVMIKSGVFIQIRSEAFSMKLKNENRGWNKSVSGGIGIQF